jgi:hypothetical protein
VIGFGVSAASTYVAGGTSLSPVYPTAITSGQMLVLAVIQKGNPINSGTVSTPSGWTLVGSHLAQGGYGSTATSNKGNSNLFIFTKVADGSETGSVTVPISSASVTVAWISRFTTTSSGWDTPAASFGAVSVEQPYEHVVTTDSPVDMQAGDALVYIFVTADYSTGLLVGVAEMTSPTAHINPVSVSVANHSATVGYYIGSNFGYVLNVGNGSASGPVTWKRNSTSSFSDARGPFGILRLREAPPLIMPSTNIARAVEATAANPSPLGAAVQNMTAVEATAANPSPLGAAVQNMTAIEMTVAWRVEDIPLNDCWVWDGSQEVPASVFVWDGAAETSAGLEVV